MKNYPIKLIDFDVNVKMNFSLAELKTLSDILSKVSDDDEYGYVRLLNKVNRKIKRIEEPREVSYAR